LAPLKGFGNTLELSAEKKRLEEMGKKLKPGGEKIEKKKKKGPGKTRGFVFGNQHCDARLKTREK